MSHFECHLNRRFWRLEKVVQVVQRTAAFFGTSSLMLQYEKGGSANSITTFKGRVKFGVFSLMWEWPRNSLDLWFKHLFIIILGWWLCLVCFYETTIWKPAEINTTEEKSWDDSIVLGAIVGDQPHQGEEVVGAVGILLHLLVHPVRDVRRQDVQQRCRC